MSTRAQPLARTILASVLYRSYLAALAKLRVGRRATEERRWTRRRFEDVVDESSCDSGVDKGSMRFRFVGLGSEDMGAGEELTRTEGKLTA